MSRLKAQWQRRDLSQKRCVYWWADGIYSGVCTDNKLCLLVITGVTEHGRKELVAVEDNALSQIYPEAGRQCCWVHKVAKILVKLAKSF